MLSVLDLFSGIGGFSLGLERTLGFKTAAFCEVDKNAQKVLSKHWSEVPIYDDVRSITRETLKDTQVDLICGGFPCQDISTAGLGRGLSGERSGLWYEYLRVISEFRPKYVLIENVSVLRSRGLAQVLKGLSEIGYDAEWHCITASSVGAPHRRDRIWIISYPTSILRKEELQSGRIKEKISRAISRGWWSVEPQVGRVAHGIPRRVDRLKQLGNTVVPQVVEFLGRQILNHEESLNG